MGLRLHHTDSSLGLLALRPSERRPDLSSGGGGEGEGAAGNDNGALFALPNACRGALHGGRAAEGALVRGVLRNFKLLHDLAVAAHSPTG